MAEAKCLNSDCDRSDPWTLRKQPSEYARGPTCPDCGTTRVEIAGAAQEAQQAQAQAPAQANHQSRQAPQPAQQGQQAQAPANPQERNLQQGVGLGNIAYEHFVGDKDTTGDLLQVVGAGLLQGGQRYKQEQERRTENARQATSDEIQVSEQYVECPECGAQLTNVPDAGEFTCGGCGVLLERTPGGDEAPPQGGSDQRAPQPGEFQ